MAEVTNNTPQIPGSELLRDNKIGLAGGRMPDIKKFNIGGPAEVVGNQMSIDPVITSKADLPEAQMPELSDANLGDNPNWRKDALEGPKMMAAKPDQNKEMEQRNIEEEAARGRQGESRAEKLIRNGKTPSEIMEGVQLMLEVMSDSNVPSMFNDHWTPQRAFGVLYTRWQNLRVSLNDISTGPNPRVELNKDENGDPDGTGKIADAEAADHAIYVKQKMTRQTVRWTIQKIAGKEVETEEQAMMPTYEYYFGTDQERKDMARACERAFLAFGGRAMLGVGYGIHDSALRDDLNGLVTTLYESGPKFTIPQLIELLNLADVKEIGKNIEDHTVGDQVEKELWWQYAMLNCEKKSDLVAFLARPATDALIMPGASKEDRTRFLKTMLGDWDRWNDNGRTADTLAQEVADGFRGPLSKNGNMVARGIFSYDTEDEFIKTLAEVSGGSVESVWVSIAMMTVFNVYNRYGAVEFGDGSFLMELGKANNMHADDVAKANLPTFQLKERSKGRPSGPEDYYRIAPDLAVSWLDMAKVKGEIRPGVVGERTLENFWLGVSGQVDYHRLGGINLKTLPKGSVASFYQMLWLIGRDGDGTIPRTIESEPDGKRFTPNSMRRDVKYDQITINPATLKLENKGFTDLVKAKKEAERIQRHTTERLFIGRKGTTTFIENIEPHDTTVRSDGAGLLNKNPKNPALVDASTTLMYDDHVKAIMQGEFLDIEEAALRNTKIKQGSERGVALMDGSIVAKEVVLKNKKRK